MRKILICILLLFPVKVWALDIPDLVSDKVLVYDLTDDEIIYEKKGNITTNIASLTKILTGIVAIENIPDLDSKIVITSDMLANIYWNASRAGLKVGDEVTYRDLLYALLLPSGADAAQVLAINLKGSSTDFVNEMNNFALNIGMDNSNFVNIIGLDNDNHYSTLEDVLVLLKYALNNPVFKDVFTTKEYTLNNTLKVKSTIKNYEEKYQIDTSRILGSKTGTTNKAGLCLASYFIVKNHEILSITTNAPLNGEVPINLMDTLHIINYLDNNYEIKERDLDEIITDEVPNNEVKTSNYSQNYSLIIIFSILTILLIIHLVRLNRKLQKH